jgi:hypothetical protein
MPAVRWRWSGSIRADLGGLLLGDLAVHLVHVDLAGLRDELFERRLRERAGLGVEHDPIEEMPNAPASSGSASVSTLPNTMSSCRPDTRS